MTGINQRLRKLEAANKETGHPDEVRVALTRLLADSLTEGDHKILTSPAYLVHIRPRRIRCAKGLLRTYWPAVGICVRFKICWAMLRSRQLSDVPMSMKLG